MKIFILFKVCLIEFVSSKLSAFQIKEVIGNMNLSSSDRKMVEFSLINPVFGYLFESTGTLSNLRLYGMNMNGRVEEGDGEHLCKDSVFGLLVELFPSPAGTISYIRNMACNFGLKFDKKKREGIIFLSTMFAHVLKSSDEEINEFPEHQKIKKLILSKDDQGKNLSSIFDSRVIKLMTIHAFILNILDETEDLELYLQNILDKVKDAPMVDVSENVLDRVLAIERKHKDFPYSKLRQPPPSAVIPFYYRGTDEFSNKKRFSDCVETVLLSVCNCIFYDAEQEGYSTKGVDLDAELVKFYSKYKEVSTVSLKMRKDWSRVVQGLDDFENKDGSRYRTNVLSYRRASRNEINAGIMNMMNFLMKMFRIDNGSFWKGFNGRNLEKKLKELFEIVGPRGMVVDTSDSKFREFKRQDGYDFEGSFKLVFRRGSRRTAVSVEHSAQHASLSVVDLIPENSNYVVRKSSKLAGHLFERFISGSEGNNRIEKKMDIFTRIYFTEYIQTDEQKRGILVDIFDVIGRYSVLNSGVDGNIEMQVDTLKEIAENILRTVDSNDRRQQFKVFLVYKSDLSPDEIVDCWIKSARFINLEICRVWEARVLETKIESLKLKGSEIANLADSAVLNIFRTLRKLDSVKSVEFEGIRDEKAEVVSQGLREMTEVTSVSFRNCRFVKRGASEIAKALCKLTNLKVIDFGGSWLGNRGAGWILREIVFLKKVETVSFSKTGMNGGEGVERIFGMLKECKSLRSVDLSGNRFDSIDSVKLICECFGELWNLERVDISNSLISRAGVAEIAHALLRLPKLESVSLTNELAETGKETLKLAGMEVCIPEEIEKFEVARKKSRIKKFIKRLTCGTEN